MNGNESLVWVASLYGIVICAACVAAGVYLVRTPAERLLRWDRRTGYLIYQTELKATGDEQRAMTAVGRFYKSVGYCFVIMAAGIFVVWLYLLLLSLNSN